MCAPPPNAVSVGRLQVPWACRAVVAPPVARSDARTHAHKYLAVSGIWGRFRLSLLSLLNLPSFRKKRTENVNNNWKFK